MVSARTVTAAGKKKRPGILSGSSSSNPLYDYFEKLDQSIEKCTLRTPLAISPIFVDVEIT